MADVYTIVLISGLGVVAAVLVFGFVYLFIKRWKREEKGDIYLMPEDTRTEGELPVELRGQRDYRYKDANVDPYEKKE